MPSLNEKDLDVLIDTANFELENVRKKSSDLVLSPFKGNNKAGCRRRRLDYAMARKILGRAMLATRSASSLDEGLFLGI
jgi:hypothetical protein